eukprot:725769-Amphidinium_carterae.1
MEVALDVADDKAEDFPSGSMSSSQQETCEPETDDSAMTFTLSTASRPDASRRSSLEERYNALDLEQEGPEGCTKKQIGSIKDYLQQGWYDENDSSDSEVGMTYAMTTSLDDRYAALETFTTGAMTSAPSRRTSLEDRYAALETFIGTERIEDQPECTQTEAPTTPASANADSESKSTPQVNTVPVQDSDSGDGPREGSETNRPACPCSEIVGDPLQSSSKDSEALVPPATGVCRDTDCPA